MTRARPRDLLRFALWIGPVALAFGVCPVALAFEMEGEVARTGTEVQGVMGQWRERLAVEQAFSFEWGSDDLAHGFRRQPTGARRWSLADETRLFDGRIALDGDADFHEEGGVAGLAAFTLGGEVRIPVGQGRSGDRFSRRTFSRERRDRREAAGGNGPREEPPKQDLARIELGYAQTRHPIDLAPPVRGFRGKRHEGRWTLGYDLGFISIDIARGDLGTDGTLASLALFVPFRESVAFRASTTYNHRYLREGAGLGTYDLGVVVSIPFPGADDHLVGSLGYQGQVQEVFDETLYGSAGFRFEY